MQGRTLVLLLLLCLPSLVLARTYGVNVYYSTLSLRDNAGPTQRVSQLAPLNVYYADKLSFDTRYWTELYSDYVTLAAGGRAIGQRVALYGFAGAWQKRFRLSPLVKPWFGLGLSYTLMDIKDRHTIDDEGFMTQRYANQKINNLGAYLVASNHWKFNQQWNIGVVTRLVPPMIGDLFLWSIGFSANYH